MPDFRRMFVPGGRYFFTLVTAERRRIFSNETAVALLGSVLRRCLLRWPMSINAIVLLPDHLHTIVTLPAGDCGYPKRVGWIKKEFTRQWLALGGTETTVTSAKQRQHRRGVWQPRYWEHTITCGDDFQNHFDYVHWNPVKHAHVRCPRDWPHSSFHRWVQKGVYPHHWGCFTAGSERPPIDPNAIPEAGEP